jgi:hypothetical protein
MYAYFKRLDYFSTECVYAPFAARGFARDFVKDLEVGKWFSPSEKYRATWDRVFSARVVFIGERLAVNSSGCLNAMLLVAGCQTIGHSGHHPLRRGICRCTKARRWPFLPFAHSCQ